MFSIQDFIFLMFKLFWTSGIKSIRLGIKINFNVSSSDLTEKVPEIYTTQTF